MSTISLSEKAAPRPTTVRTGSDLGNLARGGALNLAGAIVSAAGSAGLMVVLGRGFGATAAGEFLQAVAIFNILIVIGLLGADTGLVRTMSRLRGTGNEQRIGAVLLVGLIPVAVVSGLVALMLWANADGIANLVSTGPSTARIGALIRVLAPMVPVASVYLGLIGATQGYETMGPSTVIDRVARPALQVIFVLVALLSSAGPTTVMVAWSASYVLGLVAASVVLLYKKRKRHQNDAAAASLPAVFKDFWAFTLPRSFASIFRVIVQWLDVVLVGAMLDARSAAIYAFATRLLQFGLFVANSVGQVVQPRLGRLLAQGERERARGLYQVATGWQVAVTWPQYLIVAAFAAVLLRLLFGADFGDGAPVVLILAISTLVGAAAGPVDVVLLMTGKSTWSMWNTAAALGVNVGLNLLLIPRIGILGAAIAWAVARVVGNVLPLIQVSRSGFHPFGRELGFAVAGSVVAVGVVAFGVRITFGSTVIGLAVACAVGLAAYVWFLVRYRQQLALPAALGNLRSPTDS